MTDTPRFETFDQIARYYDLLYEDRDDDLGMWLTLLEEIEGEILEVGCGTGRLTIPLLQHGRRVTGIDISPLALQATRAKIQAGGFADQVTLLEADMRNLALARQSFAFALVPINTFMHCDTTTEQQQTLTNLYRHLASGGTLVIDLFHPAPPDLLAADGQLYLEDEIVDPLTGHTVQWLAASRLSLAEQRKEVVFILDEITDDGTIRRDRVSFSLRYLHRFEMELLLQQAGFQIAEILGDYDFSPFADDSPRMIFIATKPATA